LLAARPKKGATDGLSTSAKRVTGKTPLGKLGVNTNSRMYSFFNGLLATVPLQHVRIVDPTRRLRRGLVGWAATVTAPLIENHAAQLAEAFFNLARNRSKQNAPIPAKSSPRGSGTTVIGCSTVTEPETN
tara:strand:- start:28 stop:417 length:390 start_codon:yes stop_codon:yes gene_type:complete